MIQNLTPFGVSVPGGFGVCSTAYDAVLDRFELRERLDLLLKDVDVNNLDDLAGKYVHSSVIVALVSKCMMGLEHFVSNNSHKSPDISFGLLWHTDRGRK